jgi:hypothetical protein
MRPLIYSVLHPSIPLLPILLAVSLAVAALAAATAAGAAEEMVPFVIPTTPNAKSLVAIGAGEPFATDAKRVEAREGHFWRDGKRYRVWGVNICFGAAFPAHADAERAAERLAQAGVNSVRLHHMDCHPFPNGIWEPKGEMDLSAEALDRLDYFIDQLARRGVCVNVNLHVSRTHSQHLGLPREGEMPDYDKVIGIFTPRLVEAQRKYARDLLTHVNAYRKVRYADDPAVAFVEITNEDSFFMWGARPVGGLAQGAVRHERRTEGGLEQGVRAAGREPRRRPRLRRRLRLAERPQHATLGPGAAQPRRRTR